MRADTQADAWQRGRGAEGFLPFILPAAKKGSDKKLTKFNVKNCEIYTKIIFLFLWVLQKNHN